MLQVILLICEIQKAELTGAETRRVATGSLGLGGEKWGEVGQRAQTSSYKKS